MIKINVFFFFANGDHQRNMQKVVSWFQVNYHVVSLQRDCSNGCIDQAIPPLGLDSNPAATSIPIFQRSHSRGDDLC